MRKLVLEQLEDRFVLSGPEIVTTAADSGPGSLRQAIIDTNAAPGMDTIQFVDGLSGTITLTTGQLSITDSVQITGPGVSVLAVSGNNTSRVFQITSGNTVSISGLTIRNGNVGSADAFSSYGGGIVNSGTLTVSQSIVTANSAARGGGIYNEGTLLVDSSTVSQNSASITGGGIENYGPGSSTTLITNSAIVFNSATYGGGLGDDSGVTTVINSTVYGNIASGNGGGLVGNAFDLRSVTVSGNSAPFGGGIQVGSGLTMTNTLVAGNTASGSGPDVNVVSGSATGTFNLIGDGTGTVGITNGSSGNQVGTSASPINARLGPLSDNFGTTKTLALNFGSPAINAGSTSAAPSTDQRGVAREGTADIGAFEADRNYFLVSNTNNSGVNSLRQAVTDANSTANLAAGADVIQSNIPGSGVHTIQPTSALPTITEAVTIDGYTQPGSSANTLATGNDAVLTIELDGSLAGSSASGFYITASNVTVRGLVINRFGRDGVSIDHGNDNVVVGNFIGTDAAGSVAHGNSEYGVLIISGQRNRVGTNGDGVGDPGERNVISANTTDGVHITTLGHDITLGQNVVAGNYIGTNAAGTAALGNAYGIIVTGWSQQNRIGSNADGSFDAAERNIIAGNTNHGVWIEGTATDDNIVAGNYIGLKSDGASALGNGDTGVLIENGASNNTIGGTVAGARNIISGNVGDGINIASENNFVLGNYIGTSANGSADLGNTGDGIEINGSPDNVIGGLTTTPGTGAGNVISGNDSAGIRLPNVGSPDGTVIRGNIIGLTADGLTSRGNSQGGIFINRGHAVQIGGTDSMARNIISGNSTGGILLSTSGTNYGTIIQGNYIGTDITGTAARGNGTSGVQIGNSPGTMLGGTATGAGNAISGNSSGVQILGPNGSSIIQGNFIGTDKTGLLPLGNTGNGVQVSNGSSNNTIGGAVAGARNIISANGGDGIHIQDANTLNTFVQGNYVGLDINGKSLGPDARVWYRAENNAADAINGLTGTLQNGASFAAGKVGQAFSFTGDAASDDQVLLTGTATGPLDITGSDLTIEAWVYQTNASQTNNPWGVQAIISKWFDTADNGYLLQTVNGVLTLSLVTTAGRTDLAAPAALPLNTWVHVAAVYNGVTMRLFQNGVQVASVFKSSTITHSASNASIGNSGTAFGWKGLIDELSVYARAADATEIAAIHNAGTTGKANQMGNASDGIEIYLAPGSSIGGTAAGAGNIIGANRSGAGIWIHSDGTARNMATLVQGNRIGTDSAGVLPEPNRTSGIAISDAAQSVTIGGNVAESRNLISGNIQGVAITGVGSNDNWVAGNYIGLDINGAVAIGNGGGVLIDSGAQFNVIGTNGDGVLDAAERNVISGNGGAIIGPGGGVYDNVDIFGSGTDHNVVAGNFLGTNAAGTAAINAPVQFSDGVAIYSGPRFNRIGTNSDGVSDDVERNIISGNALHGVDMGGAATTENIIAGNYIGTDVTGTVDVGNVFDGVAILLGATLNTIGGSTAAARNVISGNNTNGIELNASNSNVIAGNIIGLNATGTAALGNTSFGISLLGGSSQTRIGTNSDGSGDTEERNIISGNQKGINLTGTGTHQTLIAGNYIGTDITGSIDLGNNQEGILLISTGTFVGTTIGGTTAAARNVIAGNNSEGIEFSNAGAAASLVAGNYIGLNAAGTGVLGNGSNGQDGLLLRGTSGVTVGGTVTGARNIISGNATASGGAGVDIRDANSFNNVVQGNYIGTDPTGTIDFGNALNGVLIQLGATNNTIGGTASGARNVISGNNSNGVEINGSATTGNVVAGNYVGTAASGTIDMPVSWYPFNTFTRDIVDSNQPSATSGVNVNVGGKVGFALQLAAGGFVDVPHAANLANQQFTLDAWVRPDGAGPNNDAFGNKIIGKDTAAGQASAALNWRATDNRFLFAFGNYSTDIIISTNTFAPGTFYHVAGTYDGATFKLFVNGALEGQMALVKTITYDPSITWTIGATAATFRSTGVPRTWNGVIDEVAIYNHALSATQIQNIVTAGASGRGAVLGNSSRGVLVNNSPGNIIGIPGAGNVVSGNRNIGIFVTGASSAGNVIQGNFVGTSADGTGPVGNGAQGVVINAGATLTRVGTNADGTNDAAERNLISGNVAQGLSVSGSGTNDTVIAGNYIGTNAAGDRSISNGTFFGINIATGAKRTRVGTDGLKGVRNAAERNVISGNVIGVGVQDSGTTDTVIAGNWIGLNAAGTAVLGNSGSGIELKNNQSLTRVGTNADGNGDTDERNVISGNSVGMHIRSGATASVVAGNYIGTDLTGTLDFGNSGDGILFQTITSGEVGAAFNNTIGGTAAAARNVISGNNSNGIDISGSGTSNNVIIGNYIGLNAAGTGAIGNSGNGVLIQNTATSNRIGTDGDGANDANERNVISGNASGANANVNIIGAGTMNNVVAGNYIGTNAAGTAGLTNLGRGVRIASTASFNRIGTDGSNDAFNANERNVISGHSNIAVFIPGGSNDNIVAGNYIGLNAAGTAAIANASYGIDIDNSQRTRVGSNLDGIADDVEGNVIAGSGDVGLIIGNFVTQTIVAGNRIGTNAAGTAALPNVNGIVLVHGATNNTIGGSVANAGNLISGNAGAGLWLIRTFGATTYSPSPNNLILGNLIGTDITGTLDLGNTTEGIRIEEPDNTIGGSTPLARNVIAGNNSTGILITGAPATGNIVRGNYIGTDVSGTIAVPNATNGPAISSGGVIIASGAQNNTIGGAAAGSRNVISGNASNGILIDGSSSTGNVVQGNYVGTDVTGSQDLGNAYTGVAVLAASLTTIGGTAAGAGNLISGNQVRGIDLSGNSNLVQGNFIGTNAAGALSIPNSQRGIELAGNFNQVGGTTAAARNVIAGNTGTAIELGSSNNSIIQGNYIGVNAAGTSLVPNVSATGIHIQGGTNNLLGGTNSGAGNVISGSSWGILLSGSGSSGNTIQGNLIGTNAAGTAILGNSNDGVALDSGAHDNLIGGTVIGAPNVISGNSDAGVELDDAGTTSNVIAGNYIGTDVTGAMALGNSSVGVRIQLGATGNSIGGTVAAARNVIAHNAGAGIQLLNGTAASTSVRRNSTYSNGGVGIDIGTAGPTPNDPGDADGIPNFPVITGATISGTELTIIGFAIAETSIELFISDADPSGFGEGQMYLVTLQEGTNDLDVTVGSYGPGAAGQDTTNRFRFVMPIPPGVTEGTVLTATRVGSISEFSPNFAVTVPAGDVPPTIDPIPPQSMSEGATLSFTVIAHDPDNGLIYSLDSGPPGAAIDASTGVFTWTANVDAPPAGLDFIATVRVTETGLDFGEALFDTETFTIHVADLPAAITPSGLNVTPTIVDENDSVTLTGTFEDPGGENYSIAINWGDGSSSTVSPTLLAPGTYQFTAPHQYKDNPTGQPFGSFDVHVTLLLPGQCDTVPGGLPDCVEVSAGSVVVKNLLPVLPESPAPGAPTLSVSSAAEGAPVTVSGSFTDTGTLDTHTVVVAWGDGSSSSAVVTPVSVSPGSFTYSAQHAYADNSLASGDPSDGTYPVRVTGTDDDGGEATAIAGTVTISNRPPVINDGDLAVILSGSCSGATGTVTVMEGGSVTLCGHFADPGFGDTHTVTIHWGDGSPDSSLSVAAGVTAFSVDHTYIDDVPSGTPLDVNSITVTVSDDEGASDGAATSVTVQNVAPVVHAGGLVINPSSSIVEGTTITLTGSFTDPGGGDTHTVQINWGDGSDPDHDSIVGEILTLGVGVTDFGAGHFYADDTPSGTDHDPFTIQITVTDDDSGSGLASTVLTVNNAPPSVQILPGTSNSDTIGDLVATVSDPGILADTYQYQWSAVAEPTATCNPVPPFTVPFPSIPSVSNRTSEFQFVRQPNCTYRVTLTVSDDDTGTTTQTVLFIGGTAADDTITIADAGSGQVKVTVAGNTATLDSAAQIIVAGGDGSDTINGSGTSVPLVLDGGTGTDHLTGGSAADTYVLHFGNDTADDNGDTNDVYILGVNSDLTVHDNGGTANALNFSITTFGITFSLAEPGVRQDVAPDSATANQHFVTFTGSFTKLTGTSFGDTLTGNDLGNYLFGGVGADQISGGTGNDIIFGGTAGGMFDEDSGNDIIFGGVGIDQIDGGSGDDIIFGGTGGAIAGGNSGVAIGLPPLGSGLEFGGSPATTTDNDGSNDLIFGGFGRDQIDGGAGEDLIFGGTAGGVGDMDGSADIIFGGVGRDAVDGGAGDDIVFGGTGASSTDTDGSSDIIFGGFGRDSIDGGTGDDIIFGGTGGDLVGELNPTDLIFGGTTVAVGSADDDASSDVIFGGTGADRIDGGTGDDIIFGGTGGVVADRNGDGTSDIVFGGASVAMSDDTAGGADIIFGGVGRDSIDAGSGDDLVFGGTASGLGDADTGSDIIFGGTGIDSIDAGAGDDIIFGGTTGTATGKADGDASGDIIFGGLGRDVIDAGAGDDIIFGGTGGIVADSNGDGIADIVFGGATISTSDSLDGGSDIIFGGIGMDRIDAGSGDDIIFGGTGGRVADVDGDGTSDIIFGGTAVNLSDGIDGGADIIFGGIGRDSVDAGAGNDIVFGGTAAGLADTDTGSDVIFGGLGLDSLDGGQGADIIFGGTNGTVSGSADGDGSPDIIFGGRGGDFIDGGAGADIIFGGTGGVLADTNGDGIADLIFGGISVSASDGSDGGNDIIFGGTGADKIDAGSGDDIIFGGTGGRVADLDGDATSDIVFGGTAVSMSDASDGGSDIIFGGIGRDSVDAGAGDDLVFGGTAAGLADTDTGSDIIFGGIGLDSIDGGQGSDIIFGGTTGTMTGAIDGDSSADIIFGGRGSDFIDGGAGTDIIFGGTGGVVADTNGDGTSDIIFSGTSVSVADDPSQGGSDIIFGGLGSDKIDGGSGDDIIFGGTGGVIADLDGDGSSDIIFGGAAVGTLDADPAASDVIFGGLGQDRIDGGMGDDIIFGGTGGGLAGAVDSDTGSDIIFGGIGLDRIDGGDGNDIIFGGTGGSLLGTADTDNGGDIIFGGVGVDRIDAGAGDDVVFGGSGAGLGTSPDGDVSSDIIFGGVGIDSIAGGAGDDIIFGGTASGTADTDTAGSDIIFGGTGLDQIDAGAGDDIVFGGTGGQLVNDAAVPNDVIFGGVTVTISSADGDTSLDLIFGGTGADKIDGGQGDDIIFGGSGGGMAGALDSDPESDIIFGGVPVSTSDADTSGDLIFGGLNNDSIDGGAGSDLIYGGTAPGTSDTDTTGNDIIFGGTGSDSIDAGAGSDIIFGGSPSGATDPDSSSDIIFGGLGPDRIDGGDGGDIIFGGTAGVLADDPTVPASEIVFGGAVSTNDADSSSDIIFGGRGPDQIDGGAGDDIIFGGIGGVFAKTTDDDAGGTDLIYGGIGSDRIDAGSGDDIIFGGTAAGAADSSSENGTSDIIYGGIGIDTVDAGRGDDIVFGGTTGGIQDADPSSGDVIFGGIGNDQVDAGAGNDIVFGGTAPSASDVDTGGADIIFGGIGIDSVDAGAGDDVVFGGVSGGPADADMNGDVIFGGLGRDQVDGGAGPDIIFGGTGGELLGDAGVPADIIFGGTLVSSGETDLDGSSDIIFGGLGPDLMDGGGGSDIVFGGVVSSGTDPDTSNDIIFGGPGNDSLNGAFGNDTIYGGPGDDQLTGSYGDDSLAGGSGNDTYVFPPNLGADTIDEAPNVDTDTLDFSSFSSPVTVDLAGVGQQQVSSTLSLRFTSPTGMENVIGTRFADTISGNDRNNQLLGSDPLRSAGVTVTAPPPGGAASQVVYLDFDSETGTGERVYSSTERSAIESQLQQIYAAFSFVIFTLTPPSSGPYVTLFFNKPPDGGLADEVDWRNLNQDKTASIDVHAFLGGSGQPPATSDNYVRFSATVAAHELGHLMGLRHADAFGTIGSGMHDPPGAAALLPIYPGPAGAVETTMHVMASPDSVGSSLFDAVAAPFFGEREATKLAFIAGGVTVNEQAAPHRTFAQAQPLNLYALSVPNTLGNGANVGKDFAVAAVNVVGDIQLAGGTSESDFYSFAGVTGDVINIEVMSNVLDRIAKGPAGAIDSVVRVWRATGPSTYEKVPYFGDPFGAFNDNQFEKIDSIIIDLTLPADGTYFIEVDTFSFATPEFTGPGGYRPADFIVADYCTANPLDSACLDTDTGAYELFMYRFDAGDAGDAADNLMGRGGNDVLKGSGGNDVLDGGAGDDVLDGGDGDDTFVFGPDATGNDMVSGGAGANHLDMDGHTASFGVTSSDMPVLHLPADIVQFVPGPSGVSITYAATATDLQDGGFDASCNPLSGNIFPIGTTTVNCSATDHNGNSVVGSFNVTVKDITPPPIPSINSGPTNPTSSTSATFAFSNLESGVMFQCQLDGGGFAACSTPKSYSGLLDGPHTFQVIALDASQNASSPTSFTWTVDTLPPNTTITSNPPNPSGSSSATFAFGSTEAGGTFQCKLDSASFAACTSPVTYTSLADGGHTFQVRAIDAAGNSDPTPASFTWAVTAATIRSIYVLNPTLCGALTMSGSAVIDVDGNVAVNSSCASAIAASGNAHLEGTSIGVVGGVQATPTATFAPQPSTGVAPTPDPLSVLTAPRADDLVLRSAVSCAGKTAQTLLPGIYPSIQASGSCSLTLQTGTYVLKGGGFSVSGGASVVIAAGAVNGVLFYNAGSNYPLPGGTFGAINLSGTGAFNLTPATTGDYAGTVIFQARDNTKPASLSGNATLGGIKGVVYAPAAQLTLSGNGTLQATLIVDNLRLSGNAVSHLKAGDGTAAQGDAQAILAAGQLRTGVLWVSIQNQDGSMSEEQAARIRDGIARINGTFAPYGVSLIEVDAASSDSADIRIAVSDTSACGTRADGVLGCSTIFGDITLISGWDWYAGSDGTTVGSQQYDFQTIVTHELGHAIGAEHSADTQSVMYASLTRGVARRGFTEQDLALLAAGNGGGDHSSLTAALHAGAAGSRELLGGGQPCPICGQVHGGAHVSNAVSSVNNIVYSSIRASESPSVEPGTGVVLWTGDVGNELAVPGAARTHERAAASSYRVAGSSAGQAVLVGGDGNELALGTTGRDILVGGYSKDSLRSMPTPTTWSTVDRHEVPHGSAEQIVDDWLSYRAGHQSESLRTEDALGDSAVNEMLTDREQPDALDGRIVDILKEGGVRDLLLFGPRNQ